MTRRRIALLLSGTAVLAAAGTALADGGRTSWPSTAALAGAWQGTATSTSVAGFRFPVTATVAVSATGRPTGLARLGEPLKCTGAWRPVSRSGRSTIFAEAVLGSPGDRCIDDGTVRLSPASGGRLRYTWSKGGYGSVAYLAPMGLSGRWEGTITQGGLGAIPARIRVVGVRAGQMEGATEYGEPLSCGGRLMPTRGTQRRAQLHEQITHSATPACVGTGTIALALRADGRMAYRWTGGGEVSVGILRRDN